MLDAYYPSADYGGAGDRKGRPYGPDKGSQWAVGDAGPYKLGFEAKRVPVRALAPFWPFEPPPPEGGGFGARWLCRQLP